MPCRLLCYRTLLFLPLLFSFSANAVYFPSGIDWTNPAPNRFIQSLYLNVLGRAPKSDEINTLVSQLRNNDNRNARLRLFERVVKSSEYKRAFKQDDRSWQVYRAPDFNFNRGQGYWRYRAGGDTPPDGFRQMPRQQTFTPSVAQSIASYHNAFCYRGEPCIDNPELARERYASVPSQAGGDAVHACADSTRLTSQFKWVAVNGTTYPRGIGRDTICMEDSYYQANDLALQHYRCESSYTNCSRQPDRDLRAIRTGDDNNGDPAWFFRDGSRLVLLETNVNNSSSAAAEPGAVSPIANNGEVHDCADASLTTSKFVWSNRTQTAESKGIGGRIICMDNYFYAINRLELTRFQCEQGFVNCQPDPANNLVADDRTTVKGKPGLLFADGSTVALTLLGTPAARSSSRNSNNTATQTNNSNAPTSQTVSGKDCADPNRRLSEFQWKSNGLSSWPSGVDGRLVCLNDHYYEISQQKLHYYVCRRNFSQCHANPQKDIDIVRSGSDGVSWFLSNGDQLTLVTR